MKKFISILVILLLFIPSISHAEMIDDDDDEGIIEDKIEIGEFQYKILDEEKSIVEIYSKHVFIGGNGEPIRIEGTIKPPLEILESPIKINEREYIITSIGIGTFYGYDEVNDIVIPNTITNIGAYAFGSCKSLKNVTIPESVIEIGTNAFEKTDDLVIHTYTGSVAEAFAKENAISVVLLDDIKDETGKDEDTDIKDETGKDEDTDIKDEDTDIKDETGKDEDTDIKDETGKDEDTDIKDETGKDEDTDIEDETGKDEDTDIKDETDKDDDTNKEEVKNNQTVGYITIDNPDISIEGNELKKDSNIYEEMIKELKDSEYTQIYCAYDLTAHGEIPEDGIELTFEVGIENDGKEAIIIHKKSNGEYETFKAIIENGQVKIKVKEFSPFMLAIKEKTTNSSLTTKPDEVVDRPIDDEPPTGIEDYTIVASMIAVISLAGILFIKSKE